MSEQSTELVKRLVVGHGRDGRCRYDPEAKREVIELAMRPGVSVARVALEHGINANLLRTWIWQSRRGKPVSEAVSQDKAGGAFIPVVPVRLPAARERQRLSVILGNGVRLELADWAPESLPLLLGHLNALPCSGSTGD